LWLSTRPRCPPTTRSNGTDEVLAHDRIELKQGARIIERSKIVRGVFLPGPKPGRPVYIPHDNGGIVGDTVQPGAGGQPLKERTNE
jgi:hypothetical protein